MKEISTVLTKQCLISGFVFGLSYFLQYLTFGLMFYLGAVYSQAYTINSGDSLTAICLLIFACFAAGNNVNYIDDISNTSKSIN